MAGFAISPVFGFATFVPVYAFCFPVVGLYMPLHWPFIAFYMLLNYYLHCGYTIEILERWGFCACLLLRRVRACSFCSDGKLANTYTSCVSV